MINYWPRKESPNGFSIENLTKQYRTKIKELSKNKNIGDIEKKHSSLNILQLKAKEISKDNNIVESSGHWANRDFNEYIDLA